MPLARTPPQQGRSTARQDTFSPSQAFVPGNALPRSPVAGAAADDARDRPPTPPWSPPRDDAAMALDEPAGTTAAGDALAGGHVTAPVEAAATADDRMDEDEMAVEATMGAAGAEDAATATPVAGPSSPRRMSPGRSPVPVIQVEPASTSTRASVQGLVSSAGGDAGPSTAASQTAAEILARPAIPIEGADEASYGKHYEAFMRALRINTVDRGIGKWSLEHMRDCFPLLEAHSPAVVKSVWQANSYQLRTQILESAVALIDDYNIAPALQLLSQTVEEGRAHAATTDEPRPDAWRPDLTHQQVKAARMLPMYDGAWAQLREEAQQSVTAQAKSLASKRELLASLENGVADGVVELNRAIELLQGFPSEDMLTWVEEVEGGMVAP